MPVGLDGAVRVLRVPREHHPRVRLRRVHALPPLVRRPRRGGPQPLPLLHPDQRRSCAADDGGICAG